MQKGCHRKYQILTTSYGHNNLDCLSSWLNIISHFWVEKSEKSMKELQHEMRNKWVNKS